jgi:hypothetical protein
MKKFIESPESIEYKQRLKEFQQLINPKKYDAEAIEKIKQNILAKRG